MRIENLRSGNNGDMPRVAASDLEDCDRPAQEVCFGTSETFANELSMNHHAFIVASIMHVLLCLTV